MVLYFLRKLTERIVMVDRHIFKRIFRIFGIILAIVFFLFFLFDAVNRWGPLTFGNSASVGHFTIAVNESQASTVSLSSSVISELTGEVTLDAAGLKIMLAGDVNGDSYGDFLVGTKTNDDAGLNAGAAYLVYGKSSTLTSESLGGSSNTIVEFTGEAASDYAGTIVGPAGDVNNDGYDDFLITAYQPGPGVGNGLTYLIYGQAAAFASNVSLGSSDIV